MKSLEYFVHWIIYEILLLFCVAPVFLLPLELHGRLFEGQPVGLVMKGFMGFLVLACFLGTPWLAHNAARRRVLEGEGPFEALANAFAEARLLMSFASVVGIVFRRRRPKRSPFENPDDERYG